MIGIYKIENKINHKIYVGQSINIEERWKQHIYKAFNSNEVGYTQPIHLALRKYGIDNFELSILEETTFEELDVKERYWITQLNSLIPNGYNIEKGGRKVKTEPVYCSQCGKVLSQTNSVTKLCNECYKSSLRQTIPSKDDLFTVLVQNNGNFTLTGKQYGVTDNAVRKWCKSYSLPYHSVDYKPTIPKTIQYKVQQIDLLTGTVIAEFDSARQAARELGKPTSTHISEVCQGMHKSAYGYGWQYKK